MKINYRKTFFIETTLVIVVIGILLVFMYPKFIAAQKYGPLKKEECLFQIGTWYWVEDTLVHDNQKENSASIILEPPINCGELWMKVFIHPNESFTVCFGDHDATDGFDFIRGWQIIKFYNSIEDLQRWVDEKTGLSSKDGQLGAWHEIRFVIGPNCEYAEWYVDGNKDQRYIYNPVTQSGRFSIDFHNTMVKIKDIKISPLSSTP